MKKTKCNLVRGCDGTVAHKSYPYLGGIYRVCHMHLARLRRGSPPGSARARAVGASDRNTRAAALHLAGAVNVTGRRTWVNAHRIRSDGAVYYELPFVRRSDTVYEVPVARMTAWKSRAWVTVKPEKDRDGFVVSVTKAGAVALAEVLRGSR